MQSCHKLITQEYDMDGMVTKYRTLRKELDLGFIPWKRSLVMLTSFYANSYLIANFDTCRISSSDNNEVLWVFKTRSHWMKKNKNMKCRLQTNIALDQNRLYAQRRKFTTYCWDSLHTPLQREG